jgi:hypothetical protein
MTRSSRPWSRGTSCRAHAVPRAHQRAGRGWRTLWRPSRSPQRSAPLSRPCISSPTPPPRPARPHSSQRDVRPDAASGRDAARAACSAHRRPCPRHACRRFFRLAPPDGDQQSETLGGTSRCTWHSSSCSICCSHVQARPRPPTAPPVAADDVEPDSLHAPMYREQLRSLHRVLATCLCARGLPQALYVRAQRLYDAFKALAPIEGGDGIGAGGAGGGSGNGLLTVKESALEIALSHPFHRRVCQGACRPVCRVSQARARCHLAPRSASPSTWRAHPSRRRPNGRRTRAICARCRLRCRPRRLGHRCLGLHRFGVNAADCR